MGETASPSPRAGIAPLLKLRGGTSSAVSVAWAPRLPASADDAPPVLKPPAAQPAPGSGWPYESVLADEILEATLDLVVALVMSTLARADGVSVSLVSNDPGEFHTPSASSPEVRDVDAVQYESGGGPCLGAIRTARPSNVTLASDGHHWPEFAARAAQRGFASVLALPLISGELVIGALNVYSRGTGTFTSCDQQVVVLFAQHAAAMLRSVADFMSKGWIEQHLGEAVSRAERIGQAKGILMASGYSSEEAQATLRRASRRTNRGLSDVARDIVTTKRRGRSSPGIDLPS